MLYEYMSGAGNDFIVMDARGLELNFEELAKKLCAMTGADGFMAVDYAENADFRLHFYNSDGSRADMCGNGSRCVCKFAYDHAIAGEQMTVQTDAGIVQGWRVGEREYRVKLTCPREIALKCKPGVDYVHCGVPHALQEIPGLEWTQKEALREQAVSLRYDKVFPAGANVTFYTWLKDGEVRVLSYERGVEDYTLACGTGCGALAVALYSAGKLPQGKLIAHNPGGTLQLTVEAENGDITAVFLQGPAESIAQYEV